MGGGASSTARMTAVQSQHKNRLDKFELCGNKARMWGAGFAGTKDADGCLTDFTLTNTGRVGIGELNPTEALHVNGSARVLNLRIGEVGYGPTTWMGIGHDAVVGSPGNHAILQNNSGRTLVNSSSGEDIEFRINNNTKMSITSTGDVGIGIPAPGAKLHVNGNIRSQGMLTVQSGGSSITGNATFANNVSVTGSTTAQTYFHTSDRRLKDDIQQLDDVEDFIMHLKPVRFKWKNNQQPSMGFVAQDVEVILPQAVTENSRGYKAVDYDIFIAPMISLLQSQQEQLRAQDAEIQRLKSAIAGLKGDGGN